MITNGYAKLDELKHRLYPEGVSSTGDDSIFESVIEAVSRLIDEYCARRFYAATETRYYTGEMGNLLWVDDVLTITTLKTDEDGDRVYETTWAATDYDLEPYNAALNGKPYTRIRISPNGNYSFPTTRKGVEIAGSWGHNASGSQPKPVKEACLLQGVRLFKRKDAPFGVIGSAELGQLMVIPRLDPDVKLLLDPYRKLEIGGI